MSKPLTLVHLSDLHFTSNRDLLRESINKRQLPGKRLLGGLNYQLRRKNHFSQSSRMELFKRLSELDWDVLIITGDLTTLALDEEFAEARQFLEPLFSKGKVLITPGNHDRYVKNDLILDPFGKYFSDCWPFSQEKTDPSLTRFYEVNDQIVIVEFDMAIHRPWFSSRGILRPDLEKLKKQLANLDKNRMKIAIGHYPAFIPPGEHEGYFHSFPGKNRMKQFLLDQDFRLYLHGHIHKSWHFEPVKERKLTSINSGGCCRHTTGEWSGFHKITIAGDSVSIKRIRL
jgi:predicted MPP superfamily phosphohydrolase